MARALGERAQELGRGARVGASLTDAGDDAELISALTFQYANVI